MMRHFLKSWRRDARGVAAVEFAFIAPVIGVMIIMSYGVWEAAVRQQNLRSALKVGAEYYMNGGANDATARAVALAAWEDAPSNANVTTARICRCGSTVVDCTAMCSASAPPAIYVVLHASASDHSALFSPIIQADRVARVR